MTQGRCVKENKRNSNTNRFTNRKVAWDDLRAMTPFDPYIDFSKPKIGYILDDDDNYPEGRY